VGFNTVVLIRNDGLHDIESDPAAFVAGINKKLYDGGDFGVGSHCNPAQVIRTGHADEFRVLILNGNLLTEADDHKLLERCKTDQHFKEMFKKRLVDAQEVIQDALKRINGRK
jgi:hypothetical protein